MTELRTLVETWFYTHGFNSDERVGCDPASGLSLVEDARQFLARVVQRPGMYLGDCSAWSLYCYLAGMDRGGDWLGLPKLSGLREIVDGIAQHSKEAYGSEFGAYRVYRIAPGGPADLLSWVGI
jgi:hypothetical protein